MIIYIGEIETGYFIEEVAKSYNQTVKYTGIVSNLDDILIKSLKEKAEYIIINVSQLVYSSYDIVSVISRIKETASDSKIIVMAQGYLPTSSLIDDCHKIGITDFLFSTELGDIKDELAQILNPKTKQDKEIYDDVTTETISHHKFPQTEYKNRKTIAVVGSLSRIGTTTQCLQIVKYFQSCGKKACYIEFNNTGFLNALKKYYTDIQEKENYLMYSNIALFHKEDIETILKEGKYDYYIYDYGVVTELDQRIRASFLEKSKKLIVCGTSPVELEAMGNVIQEFYHSDIDYIFSFVPEQDKQDTMENMCDRADRVYFAEYTPDAFFFSSPSIKIYNRLFDENLKEVEQKTEKRGIFGRKKGRAYWKKKVSIKKEKNREKRQKIHF